MMTSLFLVIFVLDISVCLAVTEVEPSSFYMISLPKALLLETDHNIFIQIAQAPAVLQINSQDPISGIQIKGEPVILRQSISRVTYQIPFAKFPSGNIHLFFHIDICENQLCSFSKHVQGSFLTKSVRIPVMRDNFLIFGETNKPIYRPGELIRFRFLCVYPTNLDIKTATQRYEIIANKFQDASKINYSLHETPSENRNLSLTFREIYLEDSTTLRIAQWRKISWEKAMFLNYQLNSDSKVGSWKIIAKLNGQRETVSFTVAKYVLPKFTADLNPPKSLLISDNNVSFSVCARYSTGRPMRATIRGRLCVKSAIIVDDSRPCIHIMDELPGNIQCKQFTAETDILKLRSRHFKYWNTRAILEVEVEEDGTGEKVQVNNVGVRLERTGFKIVLNSLDYYKPGLPYYGVVKTHCHNGDPYSFAKVEVSVVSLSYYSKWGFSQQYETDDKGQITFFMPPFPAGQDYSLAVREIREEEAKRPYFLRMVPATFSKTVTAWSSIYKSYLQIAPITETELNNAACNKPMRVTIQCNKDLRNQHVYVHILSRGQLVSMQDISPGSLNVEKSCQSRDDELGHYTCTGIYGDQILIQCMQGWSGENCLTPLCTTPCQNGICTEPERCLCKEGWKGVDCSECEPRRGCLNGRCQVGNDCQCFKGWRGYLCDKKRTVTHSLLDHFVLKNKVISTSKLRKTRQYRQNPPVLTSTFRRVKRTNPNLGSPFLREIQEKLIFSREIAINIPQKTTPNAHVIVYITLRRENNTEIVAESFDLNNIGRCASRSSDDYIFKFDRKTAEPGSKVNLEIVTGTQKNKCSLRINDAGLNKFETSRGVDINELSKKLIDINKKIRNLSKNKLYDRITKQYCKNKTISFKGMKIYFSNQFDSNKAFNHAGIFAVTNAQVLGEVCENEFNGIDNIIYSEAESLESSNLDLEVIMREFSVNKAELSNHLRIFLPETWQFEYLENPPKVLSLTVPDSITTWKANIYCVTEKGLWVAPPAYLTVITPFYIDVVLPYSMKYREIIDIPVRLFNYLSECYELSAEIILPQEFKTVKLIGKRKITTCMCDNESKIITFQIIPISIGQIDIIVQAEAIQSQFCSNRGRRSAKVPSSDAIRRGIQVEPEGIAKELTAADLVCLKNETVYISKQVTLPSSTFPGSERGYLIYSGDVMGTTLVNLDQLINLPRGCGEQNMARMVPSIYVLDYFRSLNLNRPNIAKKAIQFISIGYNEQLRYRRKDGSFAAFGEKDTTGSTWLTAFVLKSFMAAQEYIEIDKSVLQTALSFIESRQTDDGCFEEKGSTFSNAMKGGVNREDSSNLLLTAYVLTALSNDSNSLTERALDCLKYNFNPNSKILDKISNYSLALITYAFSLHEPAGLLTELLINKLVSRSIIHNGVEFWSDNPRHIKRRNSPEHDKNFETAASNSLDVETTAYAYLALEYVQPLVKLMRPIRWLTSQRNSIGGFHSTQDTVIGLKALSNFAGRLDMSTKTDIEISIQAGAFSKQDHIQQSDRLLTRQVKIEGDKPKEILWNLTGNGCIYVQSTILYSLIEPDNVNSPFALSFRVTQHHKTCMQASLSVCFSYQDISRGSGMILAIVSLVSGWEISDSIDETADGIKLVEINKGNISVYFEAIPAKDNNLRCFKMELKQNFRVTNAKQGVIKIVDYYEPDRSVHKLYSIDSCVLDTQVVTKSLIRSANPCPLCFVEPGEWNQLNQLFRRLICPRSRSVVVYGGNNNKQNIRTYFMPLQNRFYEWSSEFIPDSCGCINSTLPNESLLLITTKRWKLFPGEDVSPDGDFLVTRPEFLYDILREKFSASCQLVSPLRRMIDRLDNLDSNKPGHPHIESDCPVCLVDYTKSFMSVVKHLICNRTLIAAQIRNRTGWTLSVSSTPIRKISTDILLDAACECDITAISKKFDQELWITGPQEEIRLLNSHRPMEPSSNYLITHEGTYRAFAKHCDHPVANAFVERNDWSEFFG